MSFIDVWEITPHKNADYDNCIISVESDPDGRKAMEYAQQVIEDAWDTYENLNNLNITVTIRRATISEDQIPGKGET